MAIVGDATKDESGKQNAAALAEDKPEQSAPAPPKEEEVAPAPGVGSQVRDGKFEFTVHQRQVWRVEGRR